MIDKGLPLPSQSVNRTDNQMQIFSLITRPGDVHSLLHVAEFRLCRVTLGFGKEKKR